MLLLKLYAFVALLSTFFLLVEAVVVVNTGPCYNLVCTVMKIQIEVGDPFGPCHRDAIYRAADQATFGPDGFISMEEAPGNPCIPKSVFFHRVHLTYFSAGDGPYGIDGKFRGDHVDPTGSGIPEAYWFYNCDLKGYVQCKH